jgi:hypothetical protein
MLRMTGNLNIILTPQMRLRQGEFWEVLDFELLKELIQEVDNYLIH